MSDEGIGDVGCSSSVVCWNEYAFLRESIDYDQDGGETVRNGQLLDKIHANGMPWTIGYGEQL